MSQRGQFTRDDVCQWVAEVLQGTYIKPVPNGPTWQQVIGVPMGGKCSSELANLYCYSVESTTIDRCIEQGAHNVAKSMFHRWRYIDDILGFGEQNWQILDYGMEHKKTNDSHMRAVFLGMSIDTSGDYVRLALEPKGVAWKWKPQRYLNWSSVHTA